MKKKIFRSLTTMAMVLALCLVLFSTVGAVTLKGDVTGDGKITTADYLRIKFYFQGRYHFTEAEFLIADVNGDNKISTADYLKVKRAFTEGVGILTPVGPSPTPDLNTKEGRIAYTYANTEATEMQIAIWSPPNPEEYISNAALERICQGYVDLGITHIYNEYEWGQVGLNRVMDCYEKYGLKAIIGIPNRDISQSLSLVQATMNHPACWGFNLRDEPVFDLFEHYGELSAAIKEILPADKQLTTNFLPNNVFLTEDGEGVDYDEYERYITEYIASAEPDTVSFDHYPLYNDTVLTDDEMVLYLQNLLEFNTLCRELNLPSTSIIQSASWTDHRMPTGTELEFLANLNLISGMDGITYFLYWTNPGAYDGLVTADGEPNPLYYTAQKINQGLGKMKGVFVDYDQVGYIFTNTPRIYRNFDMGVVDEPVLMVSYGPVQLVSSDAAVLSGCFTDDNGREALYVMNFNMTAGDAETVKLQFTENTSYKVWTFDGLIDMDSGTSLELELAPGEAAFVEFE